MNLLNQLSIDGEIHIDTLHKAIYATDASVYREYPLGVAYPKHNKDIQAIIEFALLHNISIIPRAAGTSLAGQVVGNGLIVDCSRYMNRILEINTEEGWAVVQPGVILDELNKSLKEHQLFFAPETSTSTHCTIGGMFGNNSCGTHSILYGSTREHVLEAEVALSNGEITTIKPMQTSEWAATSNSKFKDKIYHSLYQLLSNNKIVNEIEEQFPSKQVTRRNTGYALDEVLPSKTNEINLCKLLAGSEGTLAFTTAIKINLEPLPPPFIAILVVQHDSIAKACKGNLIALKHQPAAIELMDDIIITMARKNPVQRQQATFINGLPKAVLLIECRGSSQQELDDKLQDILQDIRQSNCSNHQSILYNEDVNTAWNFRKAGLGVLGNLAGDKKPVAVVEDTAVDPTILPEYIAEFEQLMQKYGSECVFYAHISVGELHLRPVLNLKDKKDRELFRTIGEESARLVAKYGGSISGEHGDGRLRGEFIPIQYGKNIVSIFEQVKDIFDPNNLFNPQKIVNTAPMDTSLRYQENQTTKQFSTSLDFSRDQGMLRAVEKCNGVGFCRKSAVIGGTMCPSFQATKHEKDSTRARANVLREILTKEQEPFSSPEIKDSLDLCLSCKACKSECPSSVDMAKIKAEFTYQYQKKHGVPLRSKLIANASNHANKFHFLAPFLNMMQSFSWVKSMLGFAPQRTFPTIAKQTLEQWFQKLPKPTSQPTICILNDEFTNLYDVSVGKATITLLRTLGYSIQLITINSGRAAFSKGLLDQAKQLANQNLNRFKNVQMPIIGIEPSAVVMLRDEYIDLAANKPLAQQIANNTFLIDEFIAQQIEQKNIHSSQFRTPAAPILVHGHCQQKAIMGTRSLIDCLSILPQASIQLLDTGCCGMAGSFGYEKEHVSLSMQIGELVLFPTIRKHPNSIIAASGTSCRHQIHDGTSRLAKHPVEILANHAL